MSFSEYLRMTMEHLTAYCCADCGQEQEGWPVLGFVSPDHYQQLSEAERQHRTALDPDFCGITHPDQTDRFIRCVLVQQVVDHGEDLHYGVWVSLSDQNLEDDKVNDHNAAHETTYFGWLCNDIREYAFPESIPRTVYTQTGKQRPLIVPHKEVDHPFVDDYYNGMTRAEAERRIAAMRGKVG